MVDGPSEMATDSRRMRVRRVQGQHWQCPDICPPRQRGGILRHEACREQGEAQIAPRAGGERRAHGYLGVTPLSREKEQANLVTHGWEQGIWIRSSCRVRRWTFLVRSDE